MKRQHLWLIPLWIILIYSCGVHNRETDSPDLTETEISEEEEFLEIVTEFIKAFDDKNVDFINSVIDNELGFFVLDNPGAAIIPFYYTSWDEIAALEGTYDVAQLNSMKFKCDNPVAGEKPVFSCDDNEGWSETGCFYGKTESLKLVEMHDVLLEIGFIDKQQYDKAIETAKKIDSYKLYYIYNTHSTLGFYFAKVNERWILVCVDKVFPCSA